MRKTFYIAKEGAPRVAENAKAWIDGLPIEKAWKVEISPYRKTRSNEQNRYYWGVIIHTLSEATGYEPDDIHEYICSLFFGVKEKRVPKSQNFPSGIMVVPIRTTTRDENGEPDTLGTVPFMALVDFCQRFGAEKGIYIPDPDSAIDMPD